MNVCKKNIKLQKRIRSLGEGRAQANVLVKSYLLSAKDMP